MVADHHRLVGGVHGAIPQGTCELISLMTPSFTNRLFDWLVLFSYDTDGDDDDDM